MRNTRTRIISLAMTLCLLVSYVAVSSFATEATTRTTKQDGIELSLSTDSTNYTATQDIVVTITVKNTNDYEVTGINIETIVPEGYSVKETENETVIDVLAPGEQVTISAVLTSSITEIPDNTEENVVDIQQPKDGGRWIWVAVVAIVVLVMGVLAFCFRRKLKKLLHIAPVLLIFVGLLVVGWLHAEATEIEAKPSMSLSKNILVDGERKKISVAVSYDAYVAPEVPDDGNKVYFYTGFDTEDSIDDSVSHGTVQLQYHNTAKGTTGWCAEEGYTNPGCAKFDMASVGANKGDVQWNFNYVQYGGENLLEKGKKYEISFYAKLEGTESIPVTKIVFRDLNDSSIVYSDASSTIISGDQWTKYTVTLLASESRNVAKLMFQAGGNEATNVKLYIDDITIQSKGRENINVTTDVDEEYADIVLMSGDNAHLSQEQVELVAWIKAGNNFLVDGWMDAYGNIVEQGSYYKFSAVADRTLTPVVEPYTITDKGWSVTASGSAVVLNIETLTVSNGSADVSAKVSVPSGYSVADCGVLFYNACYVANFNIFTEGVNVVSATAVNADGTYQVKKDGLAETDDVLVRAYAILKDKDGNHCIRYSDEVVTRAAGHSTNKSYKLIYNHEIMKNFTEGANNIYTKDISDEYVKRLVGTDIDLITLTPGIYRTNLWQTKADTHWTEYAPKEGNTGLNYYERAKKYILSGGDPLQDMLDYCKEYGFEEVFVNYRMNDHHKTNDKTFATHNQFYKEHPEYWLNPEETTSARSTLNYMEPEVREYYFGLLKELVTNYDVDGLELDFERYPLFFNEADVEAGTEIMTEFVGRVRAMLDEVGKSKGKYLQLSVRVCKSMDKSNSVGLDVERWDALGYVDIVNVTQHYFQTLELDVESYIDTLDRAKIYAEMNYVTYQLASNTSARLYTTLENYMATAANYIARGVDGLSLFNMNYVPSSGKVRTYEAFKGITDPEVVKKSEKHYVVGTSEGTFPANNKEFTILIPEDSSLYTSALFRIRTSGSCVNSVINVYINGVKLEEVKNYNKSLELFKALARNESYPTADALKFYNVPLNLLKNGENSIKVELASGTARTIGAELALYHSDWHSFPEREPEDPNGFFNGDMENGDESWTMRVNTSKNAGGSISVVDGAGKNNSMGAVWDIANDGNATNALEMYQVLPKLTAKKGTIIKLTFDAKVEGADSYTIQRIFLRNGGTENKNMGGDNFNPTTITGSEWKTYTINILVTEDIGTATSGAKLMIQSGNTGSKNFKLYLDNIALDKVPAGSHVHNWDTQWRYDETHHWHDCTAELCSATDNSQKSGYAEHTYGSNNVCTVCGYKKVNSVLTNGGFEAGSEPWKIKIDTSKGASGAVSVKTGNGRDGSKGLLLDITGDGTAVNAMYMTQDITGLVVPAGTTFTLTFDAKVTGVESYNFQRIWLRSGAANVNMGAEYNSVTITGSEWQTYTVVITTTQAIGADTNGAKLMFQTGNTGSANFQLYLDNIVLEMSEPGSHTHSWDTQWQCDGTHHWHNCTAEGCEVTDNSLKDSYAEHTNGDDNICDQCGYEQPQAMGLLTNGDFEAGSNPWKSKVDTTKGASGSVAVSEGLGVDGSKGIRFTIISDGTAANAVYTRQDLPDLVAPVGTIFTLTFDAKVSGIDSYEIQRIWLRSGAANVNMGSQYNSVNIGTEWQTYTITITTTADIGTETSGAQLYFQTGNTGSKNFQLYLDNVVLEMSEPEVHTHSWDSAWQSNETHHWHNCTAEGCEVTDNSLKDGYAEHTYGSNNVCTVCGYKKVNSVLTNGNFEAGFNPWKGKVDTNNGASGAIAVNDGYGVDGSKGVQLSITSDGTAVNAIYLYQELTNLAAPTGTTFTLTFDAKVSGVDSYTFQRIWLRSSVANVNMGSQYNSVNIGTEWQTYTITITTTAEIGADTGGARLMFQTGNTRSQAFQLHLDNIVLEMSAPEVHTHSWDSAWQSNETHHWHNCTAEGCEVTDNSLKDGYTEHAYGDDNICDACAYEKPEQTQQLLTNGNFEAGSNPWKSKVDTGKGASGSVAVGDHGTDGSKGIRFTITSDGTAANAIYLRQDLTDLVAPTGTTFTLTFDAKVSGVDSYTFQRIWLRSGAGNVNMGSQYNSVNIGTEWQTYTITITTAADIGTATSGAQLYFQTGNTGSENFQLYLDNISLTTC